MTTADAPLPDPPPPVTTTDWPPGEESDEQPPDPEPPKASEVGDVDYEGHAGAGPF
ncbi:hypothetical protein [Mycolicibacterium hodleri]|uniref:hypothetical protein n=1 Tax=Mycolicibacterium hodleri TaxID=49897 RepID=UPI00163C15D3|nr:hypothetical protein [Mycolicibacterium hodleri]